MIQQAIDLWNDYAARCGWPQIRRLTVERERKLRRLLRNGLEEWEEALVRAEESDFLAGRSEKSEEHSNWRLTFDTFIRESFFVRIIEGNYDNRRANDHSQPRQQSPENVLWQARLRNYKPGGMWLSFWGSPPSEDACQAPKKMIAEWRAKNVN